MRNSENPFTHYGKPALAILVGLASVFGAIYAFIPSDFFASNKYWIGTILVLLYALLYIFWLALEFRSQKSSRPIVRKFLPKEGLLLVSYKDWLGVGVETIISLNEGDLERILCPGRVINVQDNGLVQILIAEDVDGVVKTKIEQQSHSAIIIRPGGWKYGQ